MFLCQGNEKEIGTANDVEWSSTGSLRWCLRGLRISWKSSGAAFLSEVSKEKQDEGQPYHQEGLEVPKTRTIDKRRTHDYCSKELVLRELE